MSLSQSSSPTIGASQAGGSFAAQAARAAAAELALRYEAATRRACASPSAAAAAAAAFDLPEYDAAFDEQRRRRAMVSKDVFAMDDDDDAAADAEERHGVRKRRRLDPLGALPQRPTVAADATAAEVTLTNMPSTLPPSAIEMLFTAAAADAGYDRDSFSLPSDVDESSQPPRASAPTILEPGSDDDAYDTATDRDAAACVDALVALIDETDHSMPPPSPPLPSAQLQQQQPRKKNSDTTMDAAAPRLMVPATQGAWAPLSPPPPAVLAPMPRLAAPMPLARPPPASTAPPTPTPVAPTAVAPPPPVRCWTPPGYVVPAEPTVALPVPRPGDDAAPLWRATPVAVFDRHVAFREYPDHRYFYWPRGPPPSAAAAFAAAGDPVPCTASEDDYVVLPDSFTSFLAQYFEPFDAPVVAARISKSPRSAYYGREVESILAQWQQANELGTAFHLAAECFYNRIEQPDPTVLEWPEWRYFLNFHREFVVPRRLRPLRTEMSLMDADAMLAGQLDMLFAAPVGEHPTVEAAGYVAVEMYDWKRTKEISDHCFGAPKFFRPPLAHVRDTKRQHYRYQLCGYTLILERHTRYRVVRAGIVRFHPTAADYELIDVALTPTLRAECAALIDGRAAALHAGTPLEALAPPPAVAAAAEFEY